MKSLLNIEEHPLEPFLPANAKLLMLGSFPPQKKRWSMEFFYPNLQNDMWRFTHKGGTGQDRAVCFQTYTFKNRNVRIQAYTGKHASK